MGTQKSPLTTCWVSSFTILTRRSTGSFRLRCNGRNLLVNLPRFDKIVNTSCGGCAYFTHETSHLILHRPATHSLRPSLFGINFLFATSGPTSGDLVSRPASGAPWSFAMARSLGRGWATTVSTAMK